MPEELASVALAPMVTVDNHIFEENHKSALRRADGEQKVDHTQDQPVFSQHKNPAPAGLFEDEPQPPHLLGAIRGEIRLLSEQIHEEVGHLLEILYRPLLDMRLIGGKIHEREK
jgi:hypothetical protein